MTRSGVDLHHHIHNFNIDDSKRLAVRRPYDVMYNGAEKDTGSTNPKIQSLLNAIINDSSTDKSSPQAIPDNILSHKSPLSKLPSTVADVLHLSSPPTEVIAAVFQEKPKIMRPVKSKPRTKGDIIGFSDGESSESEDAEEPDDSSTESEDYIDITDIKQSKVKFLPATIEGLCDRFHTLWTDFTRQGKHEHRNEIVFLLDELLRQEGITREEYTKLNNILAESVGSGIEAEGENIY